MAITKNEYANRSEGVCGVIVIDNGKSKGIAVKPGDSIWLSEEERIATANAPKKDDDNPFTNGTLVLVTPAAEIRNRRDIGADELPQGEEAALPTPDPEAPALKSEPESEVPAEPTPEAIEAKAEAEKAKVEAARQARAAAQAENPGKPVDETGAAVEPQGLPHQGQRAPKEEVATPKAPAKAAATG